MALVEEKRTDPGKQGLQRFLKSTTKVSRVYLADASDDDGSDSEQDEGEQSEYGEYLCTIRDIIDKKLIAVHHAGGEAKRMRTANARDFWGDGGGSARTLDACGVRDGALLTVRSDVRGGMECDDADFASPLREWAGTVVPAATPARGIVHAGSCGPSPPLPPPPTRVCCGLATGGGALNVAAHVLVALARHQRAPDAALLTGAQSSAMFHAADALP